MKRDWNLIRIIMLDSEYRKWLDTEPVETPYTEKLAQYTKETLKYHSIIIRDMMFYDSPNHMPASKGYDFLELSRNNEIWEKTIKKFEDKNLGISYKILIHELEQRTRDAMFGASKR